MSVKYKLPGDTFLKEAGLSVLISIISPFLWMCPAHEWLPDRYP